MNQIICEAIENKQVLQFHYNGEIRIVKPHCHGTTSKGNEVLRAYQTDGGSVSGNPSPWRLFTVNEIKNLCATGEIFERPEQGYNPNDKGIANICCRL